MNRLSAFLVALMLPAASHGQQKEVDELLAADRAYSAASAKTDLIAGLTAMFSLKVIYPVPGPSARFVEGIGAVTEVLRSNPANAGSTAEWAPVRGGVSADGLHGFTYGYMTVRGSDGAVTAAKYLSYWMKEGGAWKVAAYKRARRPPGDVSTALMPASLPSKMVAPVSDSAAIVDFASTLIAAEKAFSDEAAIIGLGPAFEKYGRADAMNMGQGASFTFGNVEIGRGIGGATATQPSTLVWGADYRAIVASSGDLGVSIGFIRDKANPARPPFPFFTIWRRESTTAPWRYIAE